MFIVLFDGAGPLTEQQGLIIIQHESAAFLFRRIDLVRSVAAAARIDDLRLFIAQRSSMKGRKRSPFSRGLKTVYLSGGYRASDDVLAQPRAA